MLKDAAAHCQVVGADQLERVQVDLETRARQLQALIDAEGDRKLDADDHWNGGEAGLGADGRAACEVADKGSEAEATGTGKAVAEP